MLIVDDDPDAREVVAAILRHYGAAVIVATSVSTALVALRREQVDVLIADLGMPIEDGYDLIRHVRSRRSEKIARAARGGAHGIYDRRGSRSRAGRRVSVPPREARRSCGPRGDGGAPARRNAIRPLNSLCVHVSNLYTEPRPQRYCEPFDAARKPQIS